MIPVYGLGTVLFAFLSLAGIAAGAAREEYLDSGGVRLRFVDVGSGVPVVLLHGYASGIDHGWRDPGVLGGLFDAGFRVIALEQRGHGASDKPHAARYGVEMVEDVRRLLDHLGVNRVHLVGYSMGALIANRFRDAYPKRLLSVTLAGFGHFKSDLPETLTEEFADEVEASLRDLQVDEQNDARALAWLALQWRAWRVDDERLKANRVPVLALIGAEDPFLPQTRSLAATMPQLTTRTVPGGHGDAPAGEQFLTELVDFLRSHELPGPAGSRP